MANNDLPSIEPLNEVYEQFQDELRHRFQNFLGTIFHQFIEAQVEANLNVVGGLPDAEARADATVHELMKWVINSKRVLDLNPVEIHETLWDLLLLNVLAEMPDVNLDDYQIPAEVRAGFMGVEAAELRNLYPTVCARMTSILERCCPRTGVTLFQVAVWYDNITAVRLMCNFVNCFQDTSRHIPGQVASLIRLGEHYITPFWLAAMLENTDICEYFIRQRKQDMTVADVERPTAIRLTNDILVNYNIYTVMKNGDPDILRIYLDERLPVPFTEALAMLEDPLSRGSHWLRHALCRGGLTYWMPVRLTMAHVQTFFTLYFEEGVLDADDMREFLSRTVHNFEHFAMKCLYLNSCILYLASNMHGLDTSDAQFPTKLIHFLDVLQSQVEANIFGMTRDDTVMVEWFLEDYIGKCEQVHQFRFSRWNLDRLKEFQTSALCSNAVCQEACPPNTTIIPACLRLAATGGDVNDSIAVELALRSLIPWLSSEGGLSRIPVEAGNRRLHHGLSSCIEVTPGQSATSMEQMTCEAVSLWLSHMEAAGNNTLVGLTTPPVEVDVVVGGAAAVAVVANNGGGGGDDDGDSGAAAVAVDDDDGDDNDDDDDDEDNDGYDGDDDCGGDDDDSDDDIIYIDFD